MLPHTVPRALQLGDTEVIISLNNCWLFTDSNCQFRPFRWIIVNYSWFILSISHDEIVERSLVSGPNSPTVFNWLARVKFSSIVQLYISCLFLIIFLTNSSSQLLMLTKGGLSSSITNIRKSVSSDIQTLRSEFFFSTNFKTTFFSQIQSKSSQNFMIIRITNPNLFHASDFLCFLFMNYKWTWEGCLNYTWQGKFTCASPTLI